MGSISKHLELEDRISNLPPTLISHILSFLPTIDAVRTSILSTHWYQQWTSITRVTFDDEISPPTSFISSVNHVLRLLKAKRLDEFQLYLNSPYDVTHVNTWVSDAISRHVRDLVLYVVFIEQPASLPSCLFTSRTLEVVHLGTDFILTVPSSVSLGSLKILNLHLIMFSDDESFSRLVSGCPVLEELNIQGRLGPNVKVVNISSPALKRLNINFFYFWPINKFEILLNTPSLQHLKYEDTCTPKSCTVVEIPPCLDMARLYMSQFDDDDFDLAFKSMADLVVGMSRACSLHLSTVIFQALIFSRCKLPEFPRLTTLEIVSFESLRLRSLITFLESLPQLTTLIFGVGDGASHSFRWSEHIEENCDTQLSVPHCVLFNLEVIEVDFRGTEVELEMLRYFLAQSKCLKKLTVNVYFWRGTSVEKAVVREKIFKFSRSSESCEILMDDRTTFMDVLLGLLPL